MADEKRGKGDYREGMFWDSHKYNVRGKLKSGSYLCSFCPYCDRELTRDNMIHFEVVGPNGQSGRLELSAYLNVFDRKTDIKIPKGQEIKELRCPHCHHSLVVEGRRCGFGDAHVAGFLIGVSNTKVPFLICMREGCHWHAIASDDEDRIILDDSNEW